MTEAYTYRESGYIYFKVRYNSTMSFSIGVSFAQTSYAFGYD